MVTVTFTVTVFPLMVMRMLKMIFPGASSVASVFSNFSMLSTGALSPSSSFSAARMSSFVVSLVTGIFCKASSTAFFAASASWPGSSSPPGFATGTCTDALSDSEASALLVRGMVTWMLPSLSASASSIWMASSPTVIASVPTPAASNAPATASGISSVIFAAISRAFSLVTVVPASALSMASCKASSTAFLTAAT